MPKQFEAIIIAGMLLMTIFVTTIAISSLIELKGNQLVLQVLNK